jgi:hypothetical protein
MKKLTQNYFTNLVIHIKTKKIVSQILGWLLLVTLPVNMYLINPIAKKTIKWGEIPEINWVVYAMLAGLGAGAIMASEDTSKHKLVFAVIFFTIALNIIMQVMFIYTKYDVNMIQAGLNIIYLSIAAGISYFCNGDRK